MQYAGRGWWYQEMLDWILLTNVEWNYPKEQLLYARKTEAGYKRKLKKTWSDLIPIEVW